MERLVPALGTALLHSLWQGALVALAAWVALRVTRRAAPRHALACGALLLCLLLPLVTLAAAYRAPSQAAAPAQVQPVPVPRLPPVPGLQAYQVERLQTFMPHVRTWAMPRLVLLWACGAALMTLRLGSGWALSLRWRGSGQPAPVPLQARMDALAHRMGLGREVRLQFWDRSTGPLTYGFWRPVVLVPAALLTHMHPDHLEALLAHELAHVRRRDYLVNLLQSVALCLLFYHPAVWWLSARLRVEREQAADALAAEVLGDPRRLALALDALEDLQDTSPIPALALAARGGALLDRIRHLLGPERRPVPGPWLGLALLGVSFLVSHPLGAMPHRQPRVAASPEPILAPAPTPAPTPRATPPQEPPPAGDILATGLLRIDPKGMHAWWSFVVPHGPMGFQIEVVENLTPTSLGRMGWGYSDSGQPAEVPLAFSRPRLTTSLPAFPSAVKIVVRDFARGLQGETVLLESLAMGMTAPERPISFQVVLNRPLAMDSPEPSPRKAPAFLSGVVFMRSTDPWLLVSTHPTQETWTLSVYGDDPEKPLASGCWTPGKEAFPFPISKVPKVLRLRLEDAEGRSHVAVVQVQVDPDLLGSGRSARQDFSLRLD